MKKVFHRLKNNWIQTIDPLSEQQEATEEVEEMEIFYSDPTVLGVFALSLSMLISAMGKLTTDTGTNIVLISILIAAGVAQLIASYIDFYKNNAFGATVFAVYGLMRLSLGMQTWMSLSQGSGYSPMTGIGLIAVECMTIFFTIAALHLNKTFGLMFIAINSVLLTSIGMAFGFMPNIMHELNFVSELVTAGIALYATLAIFINNSLHYRIHISMGSPVFVWGYKEHKAHKVSIRPHSYMMKLRLLAQTLKTA